MGGNNKEEIIRFGNAIIDLILEIYPQGNIVLVKPNVKTGAGEAIVKFCSKFFAIGAAIGNEGVVEFCHKLISVFLLNKSHPSGLKLPRS